METISAGNKRIAKNTLIVYARIAITTITGLLTSRYVLMALGASDFGLFNVVGGVIAMLAFISSSLSTTTTRFINFEEGKVNGDTNLIFNVCLLVHIIVALIIFILAETLGIFYINNYLNIEAGKEGDAHFVFQLSTIVACIGLINVPYQGLVIAKEKFGMVASIEIFNSIAKLLLVLLLFFFKDNVLRIYSVFVSCLTFTTFIAYHVYCYTKWPDVIKKCFKKTKGHFKDILSYNNYTLLNSLSLTIRSQGSSMIINYYFGTLVNASYAIARTVQNYVNHFTANFDAAAGPQITQNYSGGNIQKSEHLAGLTGRFSMLTMEIVFFPIFCEIEFILRLWLGDYPEGTLSFTRLTLLLVFVGSTSAGMTRIISASGKLKWFTIQFSVLYLLCLPIAILLFRNGAEPYIIVLLFIISDLLSRFNQLILLKCIVGFDSLKFIKNAYSRPFIIAAILFLFIFLLHKIFPSESLFCLFNIIIVFLFSLLLVYYIGLKDIEQKKILSLIRNKLFKNK